jgi:hypothetical protein
MRLTILNKTDRDIEPYVRLAAKVVNVPRRVTATVHYVKRGSWNWYSGVGGGSRVRIGMPRDDNNKFPFEKTKLGYYRSSNIPLHKPYRVENWNELLVGIAAHEFAHCMPRGIQNRKSRIELFCELKCAEAIELLRSDEGKAFIEKHRCAAQDRARIVLERRVAQGSPAFKLTKLRSREKKWITRTRRAVTALKKIRRQITRLEKIVGQNAKHPSACP